MPITTASVSNEYNKNEDLKKEDVEALQKWMDDHPRLPKISELDVILFHHSCYYDIEATKTTIETFFTLKKQFAEMFTKRDPSCVKFSRSLECGLLVQLPQRTAEGYMVVFYSFMDKDPAKFVPFEQMKLLDMMTRLDLQEAGTINGIVFVIDVKGFSFSHLWNFTISSVRCFCKYMQEAFPVRLKGLYFINASGAMQKLLTIAKPFLTAQLLEILEVHRDISEKLYERIPQECLPQEYGGNADAVNVLHDIMKTRLIDNAEYFIEDEKLGSG